MDKRKKRRVKSPASPPADKMVKEPEVKKTLMPFWTRVCPHCGEGNLSTMCRKCGRLTVLKNQIKTK